MFSYRHAFHAGNHADVLKHTTLIALCKYLCAKDTALSVIDTHAGAGLYRLDGDYTETSGEAKDGVFRLFQASNVPLAQVNRAQSAPKKGVTKTRQPACAAQYPAGLCCNNVCRNSAGGFEPRMCSLHFQPRRATMLSGGRSVVVAHRVSTPVGRPSRCAGSIPVARSNLRAKH